AGVDQRLRTLSRVGLVHGRWPGSLTVRPEVDELTELSDRIEALRTEATDPRALALSLLAESFIRSSYPARNRLGNSWEPEPDERAMVAADESLAYATTHGFGDLMSAALDAANAAAQRDDRYDLALAYSARRLDLPALETDERLDALIMVAQAQLVLG